MRRRLCSEIGWRRFETAWNYLPAPTKKDLRGFIRYVKEVTEVEGVCIYARNPKTRRIELLDGPLQRATGYCGYYASPEQDFCDVIFVSER